MSEKSAPISLLKTQHKDIKCGEHLSSGVAIMARLVWVVLVAVCFSESTLGFGAGKYVTKLIHKASNFVANQRESWKTEDGPEQSRRLRCPEANGMFANPEDCSTFYHCSEGQYWLKRCPASLHFSEETLQCEYPCDAHCDQSLAGECRWNQETTTESEFIIPDICFQSTDPGPCDGHFTRYTYNRELGKCEKFVYGGCRGNANKFKTDEECRKTCKPLQVDVCDLRPARGPCKGSFLRYYYDNGVCRKFIYGGCGGNLNNFATKRDCRSTCSNHPDRPCPQIRCREGCYLDQSAKPCPKCVCDSTPGEPNHSLALKEFHCNNNEMYVHPDDCGKYIKCTEGNAEIIKCPDNGHFSMALLRCTRPCDAYCEPALACRCGWPSCDNSQFLAAPLEHSESNVDFECTRDGLYKNPENCSSFIQCSNGLAYVQTCPEGLHFSIERKRCEEKCDAHCDGRLAEECNWDESVICRFPADKGPCRGSFRRYFFDVNSGRCKRFEYGGCQGNGNNFETEEDCEDTCKNIEHTTTVEADSPDVTEDVRPMSGSCDNDGLYPDAQNCSQFIQCSNGLEYSMPCPYGLHFSEGLGRCVAPCDAHCNETIACRCGWPECSEIEVDCDAEAVRGPCHANIPRYYYDRDSGRCRQFLYGGCGGNTNNLESEEECREKCQMKLLGGYRCPVSNGKFANFYDCISYYHCKKGVPVLKRCPRGMAFDHKLSECVTEFEAVCLYKCRERDAVYPYHIDCHKYIDCVNGISKVERCPLGKAFDWRENNCVKESTMDCSAN